MKKKLYFVSLGCPRNEVDSEVMLGKLLKKDYVLTNEIKNSDIFIVNTCGFLKEARDEAFDILDEIFFDKLEKSKVIITGCMANAFLDDIKKRYPLAHSIISAGNLDKILKATKEKTISVDKKSYLQEDDFSRVFINKDHLAFLKISEGCSKSCSFCIIPRIKGPLKSRSIDSVLKEFNYLLEKGVFEINLIAQDLLDYRKDKNEKNAFFKLLKEILKIKKDFWLRLLYVYPEDITDEFIDLISSDNRICKYLDIPIQHVSDNILTKMERKTSKKDIYHTFEKLYKKIPDISIRTSIIVGFPQEKERDFNEVNDFINAFPIDHLAVFKYSDEKLAKSYLLDDKIPKKIKDQRFDILTKNHLKNTLIRNKNKIGKIFDIIVDEYHPDSNLLVLGRSKAQAYKIDSNVIINDISKVESFGAVLKVKITDALGYDFLGEVVK